MKERITIAAVFLLIVGIAGLDDFSLVLRGETTWGDAGLQFTRNLSAVLSHPVVRLALVVVALFLFGLAAQRLIARDDARQAAALSDQMRAAADTKNDNARLLQIPIMLAKQSAHARDLFQARKWLEETEARLTKELNHEKLFFSSKQSWRWGPDRKIDNIFMSKPSLPFVKFPMRPTLSMVRPRTKRIPGSDAPPVAQYDPADNTEILESIEENTRIIQHWFSKAKSIYQESEKLFEEGERSLASQLQEFKFP